MNKWLEEDYEFSIEVTKYTRGDHTDGYCRNGEQIGDLVNLGATVNTAKPLYVLTVV